jgi:hypothetical protein
MNLVFPKVANIIEYRVLEVVSFTGLYLKKDYGNGLLNKTF